MNIEIVPIKCFGILRRPVDNQHACHVALLQKSLDDICGLTVLQHPSRVLAMRSSAQRDVTNRNAIDLKARVYGSVTCAA